MIAPLTKSAKILFLKVISFLRFTPTTPATGARFVSTMCRGSLAGRKRDGVISV